MIIIPANLESLATLKDGTIKLVFETQELRPADVGILFSYRNSTGFLAFKPESFQKDQIEVIESLKGSEFEGEKSKAKRMRNTLYKLWEEDNKGYDDFNLYYDYRMELLIGSLKSEFKNRI
jgi:hypothetical protein